MNGLGRQFHARKNHGDGVDDDDGGVMMGVGARLCVLLLCRLPVGT
jgi:hypothetical protein